MSPLPGGLGEASIGHNADGRLEVFTGAATAPQRRTAGSSSTSSTRGRARSGHRHGPLPAANGPGGLTVNYPEIPRPGFMTLGRNADGSTEIYLSGYAGEPPGGTFYTVRRSRAGLNVFSGAAQALLPRRHRTRRPARAPNSRARRPR
jgi:hypothetical protein